MDKNSLKRIRRKIVENKENKNNKINVETENIEKIFSIDVIASTFENRLLCNYNLIEDFWCFITNENVNLSNIERFMPIIKEEILNQYPDLKIRNYPGADWYLSDEEVIKIKNWYRENNDEYLKIKSIKKGYTKTLKMQD